MSDPSQEFNHQEAASPFGKGRGTVEAAIAPQEHPNSTDAEPWPPLPEDRLWTLTDVGSFFLFALVTMVVALGIVMGSFTLLNSGLNWGLTLSHPQVQTPIAVLVQSVWELFWILFIYQIVVVKYGLKFWERLQWKQAGVPMFRYLLAGSMMSLAIQLSFQFIPGRPELPIEKLFDTPASAYLMAFFGIGVAPFVEELVFRGFFLPVFERRWGAAVAVVMTGTLFAAIHAAQLGGVGPELLALLLVGLILSFVRVHTGSLVPSFLMHLGYNSTLFLLLFVATNRFQTLKG
ncbi:MAG: CPBP family intramembrane metalloprotease [Acidobacteria bacterium]|nr:CPBP family intramembrane metalloprotease [Acidobacteriota bacterium]